MDVKQGYTNMATESGIFCTTPQMCPCLTLIGYDKARWGQTEWNGACSLHCWRPVRVEEQRVDCLLLYDAVLLSVALGGASSPQQPVTDVSVTSQLKGRGDLASLWLLLCVVWNCRGCWAMHQQPKQLLYFLSFTSGPKGRAQFAAL